MAQTFSLADAAALAGAAAQLLERADRSPRGSEQETDAMRSAAWRLADAAGILGAILAATPHTGTGITAHTGRGFILPSTPEGA